MDCGEKFRLTRILQTKEDPAFWFAGGSAVHIGTEWIDHGIYSGQDPDEAYARAIEESYTYFKKELDHRPDETWRSGGGGKEDGAWWLAQIPTMIQKYQNFRQASNLQVWTVDDRPAIELPLEFELPGDIKIKAIPDRVMVNEHGELIILDVKTGRMEPPSALQLALYAIGIEQVYGVKPTLGVHYMTRKGELGQYHVLRYGQDMLSRWLRDFKKAVELDIFIPHTTMMCKSCGVNDKCYAYTRTDELPNFNSDITTQEEGK